MTKEFKLTICGTITTDNADSEKLRKYGFKQLEKIIHSRADEIVNLFDPGATISYEFEEDEGYVKED